MARRARLSVRRGVQAVALALVLAVARAHPLEETVAREASPAATGRRLRWWSRNADSPPPDVARGPLRTPLERTRLALQQHRERCDADPCPPPDKAYASICVTAADEHGDIVDFIQHHVSLGFGKVYVIDSGRSMLPELTASGLIRAGVAEHRWLSGFQDLYDHLVTTAEYPNRINQVQLMAYMMCLKEFGSRHTWMAYFDADEYVLIRDRSVNNSMVKLLRDYEDAGAALGLNWRMYGSSEHVRRPLQAYDADATAEREALGRGDAAPGARSAFEAGAATAEALRSAASEAEDPQLRDENPVDAQQAQRRLLGGDAAPAAAGPPPKSASLLQLALRRIALLRGRYYGRELTHASAERPPAIVYGPAHVPSVYRMCNEWNSTVNRHIKTIFQTSKTIRALDPHQVRCKPGEHTVDAAKRRTKGPLSVSQAFDRVVLRHYAIRSEEDYRRKIWRGSAMNTGKTWEFFNYTNMRAEVDCFDPKNWPEPINGWGDDGWTPPYDQ